MSGGAPDSVRSPATSPAIGDGPGISTAFPDPATWCVRGPYSQGFDGGQPMLKTHGRYDYSAIAGRPDYCWPDGRRLAVHLCLNVEHFPFGEVLGNDYAAPHPAPNQRSFAWRDYGNRVGAWRLLELAEAYDLPFALLTNTSLYDYCPEMVAAFSRRGDEIVGHGRTNGERQADMTREQERACIAEAAAAIERHEGARPAGWLGPYISQSPDSLDLLKAAGFRYMMDWPLDDQPAWFRTASGPILSVPYAHDLNDSLECVARRTPSQLWCDNLIDQFDEMLEESIKRPLVMPIVLHSFIVGQPYRVRQFRRVVEHILGHRDRIWLTRPGDICAHIESLPIGTVPGDS